MVLLTILAVLTLWLALSVPLAVLVGRALAGRGPAAAPRQPRPRVPHRVDHLVS